MSAGLPGGGSWVAHPVTSTGGSLREDIVWRKVYPTLSSLKKLPAEMAEKPAVSQKPSWK